MRDIEDAIGTVMHGWKVVKNTAYNGLGLFASEDLMAGETLLIEAPLVRIKLDEADGGSDDDDEAETDGDDEGESESESDGADDLARHDAHDGDDDEEEDSGAGDQVSEDAEADEDVDEDEDSQLGGSGEEDEDGADDVPLWREYANLRMEERMRDASAGTTSDASMATGRLILHAAQAIAANPSLWDRFTMLFPRDREEWLRLPPWECASPRLGMEIEWAMDKLKEEEGLEDIYRLPHIVRYNGMEVHTGSEFLSYPKAYIREHAHYGVFEHASGFNHSFDPNVSRFGVGNLSVFRTNRAVRAGQQLFISYIPHDLCSEANGVDRRTKRSREGRVRAIVDMDFYGDRPEAEGRRAPEMPLYDDELQMLVQALPFDARLEELCLLQEAAVKSIFEWHWALENPIFFHKDLLTVAIHLATTYSEMGRDEDAAHAWRAAHKECLKLPPNDEITVNVLVHYALTLAKAGRFEAARHYADKAFRMFDVAFGGGYYFFIARYFVEVHGAGIRQHGCATLTGDHQAVDAALFSYLFRVEDLDGAYAAIREGRPLSHERRPLLGEEP